MRWTGQGESYGLVLALCMPDGRLGWVLLGGGLGAVVLELPDSDNEVVNPRKKK